VAVASGRFSAFSLATSSRTSCARARGTTITASDVLTTTRSLTPTTAVRRPSECTTQSCVSMVTTGPCTILPAPSRGVMSNSASQLPMSDQRKSPTTTAARSVFSITA
jgi:hypothetical protein